MMKPSTPILIRGSGNVFYDLDLPNPEEHLIKAQCASAIHDLIQTRQWTHTHAAQILGTTAEVLSAITQGHFDDHSLEQMLSFIKALGCRMNITITSEADAYQRTTVIQPRKLEDVYET